MPRGRKKRRVPPAASPPWEQAHAVRLPVSEGERAHVGTGLEAVLGDRASLDCLEAVVDAAGRYRANRVRIDAKPRAAQQRKALTKLLNVIDTALQTFQELDDASRFTLARASGSASPVLGHIAAGRLSWDDLLRIRNTRGVVLFMATLQEDLEEVAHRLHGVCDRFPFDDSGAQTPGEAMKAYVRRLQQIYEQTTGEQARITHNPYAVTTTRTATVTEFWKFIQACVRPFEPGRFEEGKEKAFTIFCQRALNITPSILEGVMFNDSPL